MEDLRSGHYWKTPFVWEEGCPAPKASSRLSYGVADGEWLTFAVAQTMASSLDESDIYAVSQNGQNQAEANSSPWRRNISTCRLAGG